MQYITEMLAMTEGCFEYEAEYNSFRRIFMIHLSAKMYSRQDWRRLSWSDTEMGPKIYRVFIEMEKETWTKSYVIVPVDKIDWMNFCVAHERLKKIEPKHPLVRNLFLHIPYGYTVYVAAETYAEVQFKPFNNESFFSLYVTLSATAELRSQGFHELFPRDNKMRYSFFFDRFVEYTNFVENKPFRILTLSEVTKKIEDLNELLNCFDSFSLNQMIPKCSSRNVGKN